jgi:hypothetical protein
MRPGYIYILSNSGMPGLLKIGRTERMPEVRAKELQTTGVPHPFQLEFTVLVPDCYAAERQVHQLLEQQGVRATADREFFTFSLEEAISMVSVVVGPAEESQPDFSMQSQLAELASTVAVPEPLKQVSGEAAETASMALASIARRGYPFAMQQAAMIYEMNCPSGPRFKDLYREYLVLAQSEAQRHLV